ncbi:ectonucleoside triphosphate diphosphohydrolase 1-like [Mytilus edulis]|uniref:ENTPD1_3_8 n=1 Tax=Mytilus edulis TaxID=6550 RepID=A0A8S3SY55_MYTED|nr:CD39 [Mytilus edulis]
MDRKRILCLVLYLLPTFSKSFRLDYQYGAILDAGSTSTKVHLYRWIPKTVETDLPKFEEVVYRKFKPALSDFVGDVKMIRPYLREIFALLQQLIPEPLHESTSVYLMATAGLRFLDEDSTDNILKEVILFMSNGSMNPFKYLDGYARILSGEEEALFAWISINYLYNMFDISKTHKDTIGMVEVGGGSMQIAFIPERPIYAGKQAVIIGGREYDVYAHSFLSYGAKSIGMRIEEYLVRQNMQAVVLTNPCMLKGDSHNVTSEGKTVTIHGASNATECVRIIDTYLPKIPEFLCSPKPCTIGSVYGPPVHRENFLALGSIYLTADELGLLNDNDLMRPVDMYLMATNYCRLTLDEAAAKFNIPSRWASFDCQNGLYIPKLLKALGFNMETENIFAKRKLDGVKIGWSIGAILYEEEKSYYTFNVDAKLLFN